MRIRHPQNHGYLDDTTDPDISIKSRLKAESFRPSLPGVIGEEIMLGIVNSNL